MGLLVANAPGGGATGRWDGDDGEIILKVRAGCGHDVAGLCCTERDD